jgi:hypothetical protein
MAQSIVIKSAKFGDEFSFTDVSQTLQDKLKSDGNVALDVDSSLIPFAARASGVGTIKLSQDEQAEIKQTAADMCGSADQTCLELKTQELAQSKLKEKESSNVNAANIVKGRRLTAEYTINGKPMTVVIPEGQKFELGGLPSSPSAKPKPFRPEDISDPWKPFLTSFVGIFGTSIFTFLYVTSIIITWMTYVKYGSKLFAIGLTGLAALFPMSGYGLAFFGPAIAEYFRVDKALRVKLTTPEEVAALAKGL